MPQVNEFYWSFMILFFFFFFLFLLIFLNFFSSFFFNRLEKLYLFKFVIFF